MSMAFSSLLACSSLQPCLFRQNQLNWEIFSPFCMHWCHFSAKSCFGPQGNWGTSEDFQPQVSVFVWRNLKQQQPLLGIALWNQIFRCGCLESECFVEVMVEKFWRHLWWFTLLVFTNFLLYKTTNLFIYLFWWAFFCTPICLAFGILIPRSYNLETGCCFLGFPNPLLCFFSLVNFFFKIKYLLETSTWKHSCLLLHLAVRYSEGF